VGAPAAGIPAPAVRGPSARSYLKLDWDYPVYKEPEQASDGTTAKRVRRALSSAEAYAYIAGDDPRPLLVLRECKQCNGTDDALLSSGADNERTFLLARWFHCVKLPVDVRDENHPFYALFPEADAEHLFVSAYDGSNRIGLEVEASRTGLWQALRDVIDAEYKRKAERSLKQIAQLLDDFDVLDQRRRETQVRRDELFLEEGADSRKVKKLDAELAGIDAELEDLHEAVVAASALELKRPKPERAPSAERSSNG
jgi:hypothetical protein